MVNGAFNFTATARNLRLQRRDAGMKLLDRQGVEVLAGKLGHQIAGAAGKIVCFHAADR